MELAREFPPSENVQGSVKASVSFEALRETKSRELVVFDLESTAEPAEFGKATFVFEALRGTKARVEGTPCS